ncbi:MAG: hypothetical protein V4572_12050 [Bacteroidota bacterium]
MLTDGEMKQAMELLIKTVKARSKERLNSAGRGVWTGKMLDAIDATIIEKDGDLSIEILGEEYQDYIDLGVNGAGFQKTKKGKLDNRFKTNKKVQQGSPFGYTDKRPPISAISPWAKARGINPFALQYSIFRYGIKPVNFFSEVLDNEMENFTDYIAEIQTTNILNNFEDDKNN